MRIYIKYFRRKKSDCLEGEARGGKESGADTCRA
jgi:hypothetical protein